MTEYKLQGLGVFVHKDLPLAGNANDKKQKNN